MFIPVFIRKIVSIGYTAMRDGLITNRQKLRTKYSMKTLMKASAITFTIVTQDLMLVQRPQ